MKLTSICTRLLAYSFITLCFLFVDSISIKAQELDSSDVAFMKSKIIELESADYPKPDSVKRIVKSMKSDGSWGVIDYQNIQVAHWPAYDHLTKYVMPIAKAYANQKSSMYHDENLAQNLHKALDFWLDHNFVSLNWWPNEIGVPKTLSTILILMKKEVNQMELLQAFNQMRGSTIWQTGQNKVWRAEIQLKVGLLEYEMERDNLLGQPQNRIREAIQILKGMDAVQGNKGIQEGKKQIPAAFGTRNDVVIGGEEGIQPDWSFHQHGRQLQFGNYGLSFAKAQAKWAFILKDTPFQYEAHKLDILRNYILRGLSRVYWNATMDISGRGRNILPKEDRPINIGEDFKLLLRLMSKVDPKHADEYRRVADYNFGETQEPMMLKGNTYFWRSDFMINRTENSCMSVRMCSKKIQSTESGNGKNLLGAHLSDGATYLYQSGDEYKNIFPVWDWHRVPGVTSYSTGPLPEFSWSGLHNGSDFVGGVSDSAYGAAAMLFKRNDLTAHKSWFFVPGGLICLGAGINSKKEIKVSTSINQSLLDGKITIGTTNGSRILAFGQQIENSEVKWVYHNKTAYVFLQKESVHVGSKIQRGNWQRVYDKGSRTEVSRKVFNLWINHGIDPQNGSYSYIILPDINPNKLASLQNPSSVKVLQNTSSIQAIQDTKTKLTEIIFYHAGTVKFSKAISISADSPCMLILSQNSEKLKVTVSAPPELQKQVDITLSGRYTGSTCTYDSRKKRTLIKFNLPDGLRAGESVSKSLTIEKQES